MKHLTISDDAFEAFARLKYRLRKRSYSQLILYLSNEIERIKDEEQSKYSSFTQDNGMGARGSNI